MFINVDFPSPVCPITWHTIQPPRYAPRKTVKNKTETRTDNDDIELEAALQELMLYLLGDGVETNVRRRTNLFNCRGHDGSKDKGMEWEDGATLEIEREAKKWLNKLVAEFGLPVASTYLFGSCHDATERYSSEKCGYQQV